jgi:hypothetical protein
MKILLFGEFPWSQQNNKLKTQKISQKPNPTKAKPQIEYNFNFYNNNNISNNK